MNTIFESEILEQISHVVQFVSDSATYSVRFDVTYVILFTQFIFSFCVICLTLYFITFCIILFLLCTNLCFLLLVKNVELQVVEYVFNHSSFSDESLFFKTKVEIKDTRITKNLPSLYISTTVTAALLEY